MENAQCWSPKRKFVEASASLQLCAGQKSGSEAAIHAMHAVFEADDTDAVLLIDASNAFNALNRAAALHNIRVLCPVIAAYAINNYRQPARLFITGGKEIVSAEGTTQGDPLAMGLYALTIQPLITTLQVAFSVNGDQTNTYYAIVSMYRTSKNSPTLCI